MSILEIGDKLEGVNYHYRETCYAIIKIDDKFLMVWTEEDKNHSLAGGGIEENETPTDAMVREIKEEAGFDVKNLKEIVTVHSYWNNNLKHIERLAHIFLVEVDINTKTVPIEDWHIRVYVDRDDVIKLTPFPYQKAGFEYYLKNFEN